MADDLPVYLQSTKDLVDRAFPDGVPPEEYLPLLAVLGGHLSHENLAILAEHWTSDEGSRLNDVYLALSKPFDTSGVYPRLVAAGLWNWQKDEN